MPCEWTARAEIGLGALLVVAGGLLLIAKTNETKRIIGIFGAAIGHVVILFPACITKMCATAEHPCNLVTKPVLIILGVPCPSRFCICCLYGPDRSNHRRKHLPELI